MLWRIATNEWNLKSPPWRGAICIEECDEGAAVPAIVCYTTRGEGCAANAKLIAAAPELLDACKFAFAAMNSEKGRRRASDTLVAAIAKATT